jgi:hypothetical protein
LRGRQAAQSSSPFVIPNEVEESLTVHLIGELPPRLAYSGELQLGAARLLQQEIVIGDFHLINCGGERRFNFDSILIAEPVPAAYVPDKENAITPKFPNRCI